MSQGDLRGGDFAAGWVTITTPCLRCRTRSSSSQNLRCNQHSQTCCTARPNSGSLVTSYSFILSMSPASLGTGSSGCVSQSIGRPHHRGRDWASFFLQRWPCLGLNSTHSTKRPKASNVKCDKVMLKLRVWEFLLQAVYQNLVVGKMDQDTANRCENVWSRHPDLSFGHGTLKRI